LSKPGAENQKPGTDADRGQTGQRAALEERWKHRFCRIFAAVRAWPRPYFGL